MSSTKLQASLLNRRKRKLKKKRVPPMTVIIKNTTNLIINNNPAQKTPKKTLNVFPNMIINKYERQRERSIDLPKFSHFKKTHNDNTFRPQDKPKIHSLNRQKTAPRKSKQSSKFFQKEATKIPDFEPYKNINQNNTEKKSEEVYLFNSVLNPGKVVLKNCVNPIGNLTQPISIDEIMTLQKKIKEIRNCQLQNLKFRINTIKVPKHRFFPKKKCRRSRQRKNRKLMQPQELKITNMNLTFTKSPEKSKITHNPAEGPNITSNDSQSNMSTAWNAQKSSKSLTKKTIYSKINNNVVQVEDGSSCRSYNTGGQAASEVKGGTRRVRHTAYSHYKHERGGSKSFRRQRRPKTGKCRIE
ncbi:unnamed protein product [Moneuplotes crassus]|uniref:Uncharacterized protein n=1 Tax=Euplotes crassus TaxID=5936 RepID=A0AAD1UKT6_EUPCR|nr:unnamed protein product [Moneuplotes crassus]